VATHYRRRATSEKKIKLDNNEKLERKRTCDQIKRKRKFQTSWQKNRNWLVHNSEIDPMTCSVCIQYASSDIDKKAVFVTGSSNFKLVPMKLQSSI
jgi:hypothetical protein